MRPDETDVRMVPLRWVVVLTATAFMLGAVAVTIAVNQAYQRGVAVRVMLGQQPVLEHVDAAMRRVPYREAR